MVVKSNSTGTKKKARQTISPPPPGVTSPAQDADEVKAVGKEVIIKCAISLVTARLIIGHVLGCKFDDLLKQNWVTIHRLTNSTFKLSRINSTNYDRW